MLKSVIKLCFLTCLTFLFVCVCAMVYAEDISTNLDKISSETRQNIEETKDLINKTQNKIELIRSQNNTRAKEIENLTTKVSTIITKMSGQGKDNSALQSEILVLNELLNIERNNIEELRQSNDRLIKNTAASKAKYMQTYTKLAADYESIIIKMNNLKASLSLEKRKYGQLNNKNKMLERKIAKEQRNTRILKVNYENKILESQSRLTQLNNKIKAYESLIKKKSKSQKNIIKGK